MAAKLLELFKEGHEVRLKSKASGKNLRITRDGNVDANGGDGEFATFIVHVRSGNTVSLQSVADTSRWLRITPDGTLDGKGSGQQWTEFRLKVTGVDAVSFESVSFPEWYVGINPEGEVQPGNCTHPGPDDQFHPYKAFVFKDGQNIRLKSKASGQNLCIRDGNVDGNGGDDQFGTFIVHVKSVEVVSLQSAADPCSWLRITCDGTLDGKGSGQEWTQFRVKFIGGDVCLESVSFPGWHVGILPNGNTKSGMHTHTGRDGQFNGYVAL